jgi:ubiquinone/menaquinone biosynthesis methyltransferase
MNENPFFDCDLSEPDAKRRFNERHFTISAERYDFTTRVLSFGQDARWKQFLISALPQLKDPICIDLACGTGDLTFALAKKYPTGRIEGIDITSAMLQIAKTRNAHKNVLLVQKDMCSLDYPDASVDLVTGSYALRNAPDLKRLLAEISRVLVPGGICAVLDFSKPAKYPFQLAEYWGLRLWGGLWGLILHGDSRVHGYIANSLRNYPNRHRLKTLFNEFGFEILQSQKFFFGITEATILKKIVLE